MKLAPVIIFTFNRIDHTKQTIEALKNNTLAEESEVFIFSDEGRYKEEKEKVKEVREYIKTINGFKKINIIEAYENNGLAKSIIDGVTKIINEYGKVIVIEDDLVTSKYFLEYMNEALEIYKMRKDIWSISGYSPNIDIPINYDYEVYLTQRGCSWGWGTWIDRWSTIDWEITDFFRLKDDRELRKQFNNGGTDIYPMLDDQMNGRINSWAVRWCYNQFKQGMLTVYPNKSFVINCGMDLSGTHSNTTTKYNTTLCKSMINIKKDVKIDKRIVVSFKKIYDLNFWGYLGIIIKKIGLYKQARSVRNNFSKIINRL